MHLDSPIPSLPIYQPYIVDDAQMSLRPPVANLEWEDVSDSVQKSFDCHALITLNPDDLHTINAN